MTILLTKFPGSTFGDLLTTTNNGQGLPVSVPVPVQDGLGNNSPITMSQQEITFDTTGPNRWTINGTAVTASAAQLNQVPEILPLFEVVHVNTTSYTNLLILNVQAYDPTDRHLVRVTFTIEAEAEDGTLNAFGCTLSPFFIVGYQSSAGLNIVGTITGTLNEEGLLNPNFRWVIGVNQIILQVQELTSNINPTDWIVSYVAESE